MLKISSRGHYGLRLMTELARAHGAGPLSLTEVARTESLPLPYLEQLVVPLRRAGLVEGTRGLHGGYRLAAPPESLTVGAVLRVLEGPVALVDCTADGYVSGACDREPFCFSRGLWARLKDAVTSVLESTTLADLVHDPAFVPHGLPALPAGLEPLPLVSAVPTAAPPAAGLSH
jgi:Rrf2 family protein